MMTAFKRTPTEGEMTADAWRDKLSKIARNLTDFRDSERCQRVLQRVGGSGVPYAGRTAEAAAKAADAMEGLWQDYLLLTRVVDAATVVAARSGLLADYSNDVKALLEGPSVALPAISIPVQDRGLLDSSEQTGMVRPSDVLASMMSAFEVAKATIKAVDGASDALSSRMLAMRSRLAEVAAWSAANGVAMAGASVAEPALDTAEQDPMAALDTIGAAEASVEALWKGYLAARSDLEKADEGLGAARARIAECAGAWSAASEGAAQAASEFENAGFAVHRGRENVEALNKWMETLVKTRASGRLKAVMIGLDRLGQAADAAIAEARAVTATVAAARATHDDLAGRLRALRAKESALGAVAEVTRAAGEMAKAEVDRKPFRPTEAARLVTAYETSLRAGRQ